MAKFLQLYNTFTRQLNKVNLNGKLVTSIGGHCSDVPTKVDRNQMLTGSFYICGPTVYSDSHLGHALTYIRADLFRKFMKNYFNVHLTTVMNITDIDDKILNKCTLELGPSADYPSKPDDHPYRQISEKYYRSFLDDLRTIRVQPADIIVRISDSVNLIIEFIRKLEKNNNAYIASNGDVVFNVSSVSNYQGRVDKRSNKLNSEESLTKKDPRDFVLWKRSKEFEPVWEYKSSVNNQIVPGRPGWHVQCSAISSAFFGNRLDFHYGGKDLIFPHHYNEEACNCAFHDLDTSSSMHVWCNNWLHSSHLTIKDAKMSKSLGEVIPIKSFIDRSSVNALRLLCVISHYRSDLEYSEELLEKIKGLDHKLSALHNFLADAINRVSKSNFEVSYEDGIEIKSELLQTQDDIVDGVCNDMDLRSGLDSILRLSKFIYSHEVSKFRATDLVACWSFLQDWFQTCGLKYGDSGLGDNSSNEKDLVDLIRKYRNKVRAMALSEIKSGKNTREKTARDQQDSAAFELSKNLLIECDNLRSGLDKLGYIERDSPAAAAGLDRKIDGED